MKIIGDGKRQHQVKRSVFQEAIRTSCALLTTEYLNINFIELQGGLVRDVSTPLLLTESGQAENQYEYS